MTLRRPLRRGVAAWFVLMIVFAQIDTAAYACELPAAVETSSDASMAGMPCATEAAPAQLDPDQPALCLQHCQYGATHAYSDAPPVQPPTGPAYATVVFPAPPAALADGALTTPERDRSRNRAPPPTHAVLHCCRRL
jgi:hypothetical protein